MITDNQIMQTEIVSFEESSMAHETKSHFDRILHDLKAGSAQPLDLIFSDEAGSQSQAENETQVRK